MRYWFYIILIPLLICENIFGAVDNETSEAITAEVNEMLNDHEAFPKHSKQYQKLHQFKKKLNSLFGDTEAPSVQTRRHTPPAQQMESESYPTGNRSSRSNYAESMRSHRALTTELNQVNSLHQAVNKKYQKIQNQLEVLRHYHQDITNGKDVGEEYDNAMEKYEQDQQDYQQIKKEYQDALDTYTQHQRAYRNRGGY